MVSNSCGFNCKNGVRVNQTVDLFKDVKVHS